MPDHFSPRIPTYIFFTAVVLVAAVLAGRARAHPPEHANQAPAHDHLAASVSQCDFSRPGITPQCQLELAHHFAPIILQNTRSATIRRDFITRFDFDGDNDPTNQRANGRDPRYPLPAHVYFVVIEGKTHRFIGYAFYHPEDYKRGLGHENDMEGIMLTVSYPGATDTGRGQVLVIETLAHNQLYQYYNHRTILDAKAAPGRASEDKDGGISYGDGTSHPFVQVEAKGHGVHLLYYEELTRHVIIYRPSMREVGETPMIDGSRIAVAEYALEALEDSVLWRGRQDSTLYRDRFRNWNGRLYERRPSHQLFEAFRGGNFFLKANPPWAWDDLNDPGVRRGDWYLAPAHTVASHLVVPGLDRASVDDPRYYISHPFLEYAGNPPVDRQPEVAIGAGTAEATQTTGNPSDTIRLYGGADLREWVAGDDSVAIREDGAGDYIEVPIREVDSSAPTVATTDVELPVGRRNAIRLRYQNPYGVPAVRATFIVARRDGNEERRVSSTVILATTDGREGESVDVNVREAMVYNAEEDDIEDLYIVGVELEFTSNLGPWGAEELSAYLPAALRSGAERFRRVRESDRTEGSINVREISIIAEGQ